MTMGFGTFLETGEKGLLDLLLHEDAVPLEQTWSGRVEIAEHGTADRGFEIGILEHDQRRLARELHGDVLEFGGAAPATFFPVGTEPVSDTFGRRPGWLTRSGPVARSPLNDVEEAFGRPVRWRISAILSAPSRRVSEGLKHHRSCGDERGRTLPAGIC